MNICDVKSQVAGASYEKELTELENLYNYAGNCVMNGFLGSSVTDISYDRFGKFEFQSKHFCEDLSTLSTGVVLEESILVKQIQENSVNTWYQLFSWKKDGSSYTYIAFDNEDVMNAAYDRAKQIYPKFLGINIEQELRDLQIPIDNVMDVKVSQEVEPMITAATMAEEASSYSNDSDLLEDPFVL